MFISDSHETTTNNLQLYIENSIWMFTKASNITTLSVPQKPQNSASNISVIAS